MKKKKNAFYSYCYSGKLQIGPLKFGGIWILQTKVSKFGFYPLKFGEFGFYILTFQNLDFIP